MKLAFALCGLMASEAMAQTRTTLLGFGDLPGWEADDHDAALAAFLRTCGDLSAPDWRAVCDVARTGPDARTFFEAFFTPTLIEDGEDMLFTGYFEPELAGALRPDARYRYPIYRVPDDLPATGPWLTRQEIDEGALSNRGLEIAWLADPVDLFFLQVQGSGRIRLPDGETIRVGFGAANRHEYASIGLELVARGEFEAHQVSAEVIRTWVAGNPDEGRDLLWTNPSYVFFREVSHVPAEDGPLGAMNRSITPLRTVAVDPAYVPLGAPVWIERVGETPMNTLTIAQDTGSAIKGAQRADIFFGTGDQAGREAGIVRDGGRIVVLLPIQRAHAMAGVTAVGAEG